MPLKYKNKIHLWIGGIIGFIVGIGGNLIATWIQQDVFSNSFTPTRIALIILCSLIGIMAMTNLGEKKSRETMKPTQLNKNSFSKIKLAWSRLRSKGHGIHMEDVSAIGSDIDIDTK
jgi:hypothetical protein